MEIQNKETIEQEPVVEAKTNVTGQIFSQMPKRSNKSLIYGMLAGLIVILIAGGAWYWFKVYKKPVPVVEVKTTDTENQEPVKKLANFYYASNEKSNTIVYKYNPNDESSEKIATLNLAQSTTSILGVTDEAIYAYVSDSGNGFVISEYDFITKKFKTLIKPISEKYHFPKFFMSPDKSSIVYSELCYTECSDGYGTEFTHVVSKIYNIKTGSTQVLYEKRAPQYTFHKVVEKWVGEDQVLLGDYCECDGLPPKEEIELVNVKTGNRAVVKLAKGQVIKNLSISPNGKNIAYSSVKLDKEDAETTTYSSYIKVQNIESNETRTLKTSNAEYYDSINWSGDDRLIFTATPSSKLTSGLGGYAPDNSDSDLNYILVSSPNNQKTINSNDRLVEVKFIDEYLVVVTVDRSENVKGKLVSKYDQFMYNFETGVKTIISEDTVKWLSVYK